jgi:hypothetical protein
MTKDELTAWALANGWQMMGSYPSLPKPRRPDVAIVRLVLKATVASLEIKTPVGNGKRSRAKAIPRSWPIPIAGCRAGLVLPRSTASPH